MPPKNLSPRNPNAEPATARANPSRGDGSKALGFSLIEVLVVLTILGIFAGLVIPYLSNTAVDQLQAAATVVVADIDYARNLAMANGSEYRLTLDAANNRYQLTHSGGNSLLDALPSSPFKSPGDTAATQTTRLDHLPIGSGVVQLLGGKRGSGSTAELTDLTFTALGSTSRAEDTLIWLTAGQGTTRRYITVRVSAVTGLAQIDPLTATGPAGLAALSSLR